MLGSTPRSIPGLALVLVLLLVPLVANAQTASVSRVGFLVGGAQADPPPTLDGFRQGLTDLGYVEGRNIAIEFRFAEGRLDRFPELAAELVRSKVALIVAPGTAAAQAVLKASATIPIVIVTAGDPVRDGLIKSFGRPGGTVTGLTMSPGPAMSGKSLELLKQAVPRLSRVAVLTNPLTAPHAGNLKEIESAARTVGVALHPVAVRRPEDIDGAFAAMSRARADGLIVLADAMFDASPVRVRIRDLAARARLPAMYGYRGHVEEGGLVSYGPNLPDLHRRAAGYVDRILKGAKPGDLPVEQPTKFELVINSKTARTLGLTFPPSLLARADRVIE